MNCPSCGRENPAEANFCMACAIRMATTNKIVSAPSSILTATSGGFVGRQEEIRQLQSALQDTVSGRGRLVMLVGEPGIGKTRTAQELATYAESVGAQTLWGRCYEGEGAPPYWPWVQALRDYVEEAEPELLRTEAGRDISLLAGILPELGEKLPGLESPPNLDP